MNAGNRHALDLDFERAFALHSCDTIAQTTAPTTTTTGTTASAADSDDHDENDGPPPLVTDDDNHPDLRPENYLPDFMPDQHLPYYFPKKCVTLPPSGYTGAKQRILTGSLALHSSYDIGCQYSHAASHQLSCIHHKGAQHTDGETIERAWAMLLPERELPKLMPL
ncbi:hypothetical protein B0H17DRAFT_1194616 [Mycena rosella]|uniref:Uncharacterized protein n=1 Tax=Mycena rosella TaxID=1033263 RepID=A0AAD7DZ88_MYCRO|nr:hypothetical protein B0H17DRAFT_1194616 [Mycena rosella]